MSEFARIWWKAPSTTWGPYPVAPEWQVMEVDPDREDEVLMDLRAERVWACTDEEFQRNLAFALWMDEAEIRHLSTSELHSELEYTERTIHEIKNDDSIEALIFRPLLVEGYETRREALRGELRRRMRTDTMQTHKARQPFGADFVDRLKDEVELADFLGRSYGLDLQVTGRVARGLCPFHAEKTPSFVVFREAYWRCFGCGAGGDVFDYVMTAENLEFVPAVRRVAGLVGREIPIQPIGPGAV